MALLRKTLGYFPKSQNVPWTFVWVGGGETVLLSQWTSVESCCAGSQETAHSLALTCQRYRQRFAILGMRACGGFVLCPLSWAGTEFPRIPFLYGSNWGWPQENFVQYLENGSEVVASTLWRIPGMMAVPTFWHWSAGSPWWCRTAPRPAAPQRLLNLLLQLLWQS